MCSTLLHLRYTGSVITAQQGRPIDSRAFRDPSLYAFADSLGWPVSTGYMDHEDLEAERLFDYGILAPLPLTSAGEMSKWPVPVRCLNGQCR